jgi:hypothetical protein
MVSLPSSCLSFFRAEEALALTVRGFFCKRSKQYNALMLTQPRGRSFAERHYVVKMALRTNSTRSLNHRCASSSIIENIDMLLEAGHHIVEEFTLLRFVKHLGFRKPLLQQRESDTAASQ